MREALHQPGEQALVTRVHAQGHLRLAAVAAEGPLAHQQSDDHAAFKLAQRLAHRRNCFTVMKNVKHRLASTSAGAAAPPLAQTAFWPRQRPYSTRGATISRRAGSSPSL